MDRRFVFPGRLLLALVVLAGVFVIATQLGRTVRITCTRAGGCTFRERTLLWSLAPQTVALPKIRRFALATSTSTMPVGKSRTSSMTESVLAELVDGDRIELNDYSMFDGFSHDKADAVIALEAFRADRTQAAVDVAFGGPASAVAATLVFYLFLVPAALYLAYARVRFVTLEKGRGMQILTVRGPLRAVGEELGPVLQRGDRIETDPARRQAWVRRGTSPREDIPLPPLSRAQFDEVIAALTAAIG